jgi:hypothetical protein
VKREFRIHVEKTGTTDYPWMVLAVGRKGPHAQEHFYGDSPEEALLKLITAMLEKRP